MKNYDILAISISMSNKVSSVSDPGVSCVLPASVKTVAD